MHQTHDSWNNEWLNFFKTHIHTTAISNIAADDDADAPAEYFDLNGRKIAAPAAPGLYIRRTSTKAEKVLIK